MATYMDCNRVTYMASSGVVAPLSRLYFCRHCTKLRSGECVSHEVDSYYCSNCLENMPSADAKLKRNRCAACFDCPSCGHSLSTRATSVTFQDPESLSKSAPKKVYYLACGFCRWTSRDVGLQDQLIASGGWQEQESPHEKRVSALLDYYHHVAQREMADKEKKKYNKRRSYLHLSDRFGATPLSAKRRTGSLGVGGLSINDDSSAFIDLESSISTDNLEELDDEIFSKPMVLTEVTSIKQRHQNPDLQPPTVDKLMPKHKGLLIKRSQRCKECEHNLSKPEYNPSSIKFRIQLVAIHHVPEIRIMSIPNLSINQESKVILTVFNPVDCLTHVGFLPEVEHNTWNTAKVVLPAAELVLAPRDDTAEFDDSSDQAEMYKDDPSVVVFRKANRIGFLVRVVPEKVGQDVKISFTMRFDYRNTATALQAEPRAPEVVWLKFPIFINLGSLSE